MVCEAAPDRPKIPAEYQIDWAKVSAQPTVPLAVDEAKRQVAQFVAVLRTREGMIAGYIVDLEGRHFVCFNNAAWQRDFFSKLKD